MTIPEISTTWHLEKWGGEFLVIDLKTIRHRVPAIPVKISGDDGAAALGLRIDRPRGYPDQRSELDRLQNVPNPTRTARTTPFTIIANTRPVVATIHLTRPR